MSLLPPEAESWFCLGGRGRLGTWVGVGEPLGFTWSPPCSCRRLNQGRGLVVGDFRRQCGVGVLVWLGCEGKGP